MKNLGINLKSVLVLVILFIFTFPSITIASQAPWTAVGSTGTVDESSLNLFATAWNQIYFKQGQTGTINVRYNVTNPFDYHLYNNWNFFYLTFVDRGDNARIIAYLKSVDLDTGYCKTIVSINSNDYESSYNVQKQRKSFYHPFDFVKNAYYVDVYILRTTTSANAYLLGLKLDCDIW